MQDLQEARIQIDEIDKTITELFMRRIDICKGVAEYKIANGRKVLDKEREISKLNKLSGYVQGNSFNETAVRELFTQIMAICRKKEYQIMKEQNAARPLPFKSVEKINTKNVKVVFQGVEGAYSQAAMFEYFGRDVDCFNVPSFEAAMAAVAEHKADYAVLPIENSSAGQVGDVYDLLTKYDNVIVGEQYLPIQHCLLGIKGAKLSDIHTVYSHPQGLMQCTGYLNERPQWQQIGQPNTAMAAKRVLTDMDKSQAAIASSIAAEIYGLDILEKAVNDNKENTTRFIIVSDKKIYAENAGKITIMFEVPDESGTLYTMLSHMIYNNLNMTKIESRPIPEKPFEYRFFADFEGNLAWPSVENALTGIEEEAQKLKILGNY